MSLMWFLQCEEISRKVSESMEHNLPWYQRMGMRFHLMMCNHCSRFEEHLKILRQFCRFEPDDDDSDLCAGLPEKTKQHLKELLKKA